MQDRMPRKIFTEKTERGETQGKTQESIDRGR
jgi:hypothetical protein